MSGENLVLAREKTLSKIGRKPVTLPTGVELKLEYGSFTVTGPKGTLIQPLHPEVDVRIEGSTVMVDRRSQRKFHRALHGLTRSMIANAVLGVSDGYQKTLELMGVGYRVQQEGDGIILSVGFSHTVEVKPLDGVVITVEGNNRIHVTGCDKQKVGEIAARIRKVRPPNAYKEKGIKYSDEILRLKPGKTASRAA
ncbi:50S ribosomal protein L6 [SAR202 cluster bacterium AD-804-J14_MRT_500m]|nr:50S ribosomal protein L6 [SAR202 cluster bacterium AD-804-J14_MRT_500m]